MALRCVPYVEYCLPTHRPFLGLYRVDAALGSDHRAGGGTQAVASGLIRGRAPSAVAVYGSVC